MNKRKLVLFLPLLLLSAALFLGVVHASTTVNCPVTADSWVGQPWAYQNWGLVTYLQVGTYPGYNFYTFVKFDLSSIPSGSNIISASLILTQEFPTTYPTDAYVVEGSWTETGITWNKMPTIAGTSSASCSPPSSGDTWTFDVTSDVQSFIAGSNTNYGWCLQAVGGDGSGGAVWYSSQALSWGPVLEVTYGPAFVVPEYTFGALLAIGACFAAFIIIKRPHLNLRIR